MTNELTEYAPDWMDGSFDVRPSGGWYKSEDVDPVIEQLRGNLSMAEEGLTNYALEIERLRGKILEIRMAWRYNENAKIGQLIADALDGVAHEPKMQLCDHGIPVNSPSACPTCHTVKSTGICKEIEDAQRTTAEMPDDLKRSLGLVETDTDVPMRLYNAIAKEVGDVKAERILQIYQDLSSSREAIDNALKSVSARCPVCHTTDGNHGFGCPVG